MKLILMKEKGFKSIYNSTLYVIREICIITIGLVIALQITNWSENKRNEKIALNYLVKIKSNIETDISVLDALISKRKETLYKCETMISYYQNQKIDDYRLFEKGFFEIFIEEGFVSNNVAYESLLNSGFLKNINDFTIEDNLNRYYANTDKVSFVEEKFSTSTQYVEELLKEKGFSIEFQEAFRLNNKKEVDFNYTKLKKYPDLYSHLIHSRVFLKELIELYDALIKDAENTVTVLSDISGVN